MDRRNKDRDAKKIEFNGSNSIVNMFQHSYELDENDIGEQKYYQLKSKKQTFDDLKVTCVHYKTSLISK